MSGSTATRYSVHALPQEVADYVREHGRDPVWGHGVVTESATGFGPCRLCLLTFREGEQRTLFTHDSYAGVAEFPQVDYVNVRDTEAGCFVARVERAAA